MGSGCWKSDPAPPACIFAPRWQTSTKNIEEFLPVLETGRRIMPFLPGTFSPAHLHPCWHGGPLPRGPRILKAESRGYKFAAWKPVWPAKHF